LVGSPSAELTGEINGLLIMVSVLFVLGDGAWRIFVLCLSKGGIYPGLHVRREIEAVEAQRLGETLLLRQGSQLTGFAVCHIGAGTEA